MKSLPHNHWPHRDGLLGDTLKSKIARVLEISRSVEIDLLPGMQLLASAIKILGNADNILVVCQHWQKNRPFTGTNALTESEQSGYQPCRVFWHSAFSTCGSVPMKANSN